MKRSERIYRWLLRLYPRDFRDEYGEEMSLLFRDRTSEGSSRLWLQVLGDLLVHAPKEHWSTMKQDLRYAVRTLLRAPTFAATVIATLALGIGANSVIFSAVDAVLLRDAPVTDPDTLVDVYTSSGSTLYSRSSYPDYFDLRESRDVCVPGGLYGSAHHDRGERPARTSHRRAREWQLLRRSWCHHGRRSRLCTRRGSNRTRPSAWRLSRMRSGSGCSTLIGR